MSTTTPSPDESPARVPGWASVGEEELERLDLEEEGSQAPPPADPQSSSPSPSPTPEGPLDGEPAASSTPGSPLTDDGTELGAEVSTYLAGELEELGASALDVAGRVLNRVYRQRTKTESRLWLATQEESEAFGQAAARIAERHLPDELVEDGDPADALVLASVALTYVLRNTAGLEAPAPEGPSNVAYETPPAPQADTSPAAATTVPTAEAPPVDLSAL